MQNFFEDFRVLCVPDLQSVISLVAADARNIRRRIIGMHTADPLIEAWFTVKVNATDDDSTAVIQNVITTSVQASGQITDAGAADGTAEVKFILAGTDTGALSPSVTYVFDIQIKTTSGLILTIEEGTVTPTGDVTRATS